MSSDLFAILMIPKTNSEVEYFSITDKSETLTHFAAVSKSSPWSRCIDNGTGAICVAVFAKAVMYSNPAYLMTLGRR